MPNSSGATIATERGEIFLQFSDSGFRRRGGFWRYPDSTGNQQGKVFSLLGLGKWQDKYGTPDSVLFYYAAAQKTASGLKDKAFYLNVLDQLVAFQKQQGNYLQALAYVEESGRVKDAVSSYDREKLLKSLEVQFKVAEKDRQLIEADHGELLGSAPPAARGEEPPGAQHEEQEDQRKDDRHQHVGVLERVERQVTLRADRDVPAVQGGARVGVLVQTE